MAERCAIFVDAGYLLAEAGKAFVNPRAKRGDVAVDFPALISHLGGVAITGCSLPLLRIYWYDGARDAVASTEQASIAMLPDVKLRLGRLTKHGQKGVDALIYRDLSTLARSGAIVEAFLLSGDEDLREGVAWAQQDGVRVTLWSVGENNQSHSLRAEADRRFALDEIDCFFSVAQGSHLAISQAGPSTSTKPSQPALEQVATDYAREWLNTATDEDVRDLLATNPSIPGTVDAELLRYAQSRVGSLQESDQLRRSLRAAFWKAITSIRQRGGDGEDSAPGNSHDGSRASAS